MEEEAKGQGPSPEGAHVRLRGRNRLGAALGPFWSIREEPQGRGGRRVESAVEGDWTFPWVFQVSLVSSSQGIPKIHKSGKAGSGAEDGVPAAGALPKAQKISTE